MMLVMIYFSLPIYQYIFVAIFIIIFPIFGVVRLLVSLVAFLESSIKLNYIL